MALRICTGRETILTSPPHLPAGYHTLAPGQLANVVTCLEMRERPAGVAAPGLDLKRFTAADTADFRALFAAIGHDWMWFSRLVMSDAALQRILGDPAVHCFALMQQGKAAGLLELDFRASGDCELAFFGLVPSAIGGGLGRKLMEEAIIRAWAEPISRFWVHTCSFDHPQALAFYRRAGFTPYAMMVEVHDDPRLSGHLPETAAPQVPLLA